VREISAPCYMGKISPMRNAGGSSTKLRDTRGISATPRYQQHVAGGSSPVDENECTRLGGAKACRSGNEGGPATTPPHGLAAEWHFKHWIGLDRDLCDCVGVWVGWGCGGAGSEVVERVGVRGCAE